MKLAQAGLAAAIMIGALAVAMTGSTKSGAPAPPLPERMLVGKPTTLASLRGEPAVIDFFASWCGPCQAEAPIIRRAASDLRGRARLVAVDWSDSRHDALAFVARFGWGFPVLFDPNGNAGYAYGIQGLPTAFVLDAHGRVAQRLIGPQTLASLHRAVAAVSSPT